VNETNKNKKENKGEELLEPFETVSRLVIEPSNGYNSSTLTKYLFDHLIRHSGTNVTNENCPCSMSNVAFYKNKNKTIAKRMSLDKH
jgi:hypothetical protein